MFRKEKCFQGLLTFISYSLSKFVLLSRTIWETRHANVLTYGLMEGLLCFKHEFKGLNFKTLALTHPLVETLQTREVLFLAVVVAGTVGRVVAT